MATIVLGRSCGSCLHSNRPKQPREHAAHYEVAKTERWCFKHNCHITRETVCEDHEGSNRSARTSFTRIGKYNERIAKVREVLELIGDERIEIPYGDKGKIDKIFFKKDNWLYYVYGDLYSMQRYDFMVRTKEAMCDRYIPKILEQLKV